MGIGKVDLMMSSLYVGQPLSFCVLMSRRSLTRAVLVFSNSGRVRRMLSTLTFDLAPPPPPPPVAAAPPLPAPEALLGVPLVELAAADTTGPGVVVAGAPEAVLGVAELVVDEASDRLEAALAWDVGVVACC